MFRFAQHDKIAPMEILPLGDSALIVRVRDQFEDAPEETLDEVLRTFQRIRNAAIPGVIEVAPAYTSVSVFFDPITVTKAIEAPDKRSEEHTSELQSPYD